jgi:hypothetical protein
MLEGFHIIRRLWTMAARVIQFIEADPKRTRTAFADTETSRARLEQSSKAYFEIITLMNDPSPWTPLPEGSTPHTNQDMDQHLSGLFRRQRTSYLITLHCIKIFVLCAAVQNHKTEVIGLTAEPRTLAMRQIGLAQDFINVLDSVPFLNLQTEGEQCVRTPQEACNRPSCRHHPLTQVCQHRLRRSEGLAAYYSD